MTSATTPATGLDTQLRDVAERMNDFAAAHEANPTLDSVRELTQQLQTYAESLQFIAGELATHYTRLASAPGDAVVRWTDSGRAAYTEAVQMIGDALVHADNADSQEDLHNRRRAVTAMEQSFFYSLGRLITNSQHHDGPLEITRDGPGCLYWRHPKSGYHGGLIFHPTLDSGTVKIGSWSVHT